METNRLMTERDCCEAGQCPTCEGTGTYPDFSTEPPVEEPCDECEGSGVCPVCFGEED